MDLPKHELCYTTADDGIHIDCKEGACAKSWDTIHLGFCPSVQDVIAALRDHARAVHSDRSK